MNLDNNEKFQEFKKTGEACFNCDNFLLCNKVSNSAGLKCEDYRKIEKEDNKEEK